MPFLRGASVNNPACILLDLFYSCSDIQAHKNIGTDIYIHRCSWVAFTKLRLTWDSSLSNRRQPSLASPDPNILDEGGSGRFMFSPD